MTRALAPLYLAALAACSACHDPMQVGSVHVKSGDIDAAAGGSLVVTAADHPQLAGTSISFPPGALPATTRIAIGLSEASLSRDGASPDGPALYFAPTSTALRAPATVTIPLADGGAGRLRVHALLGGAGGGADGEVRDVTARVLRIEGNLAVLELDMLGHVQTFLPGCTGGACPPDGGPADGPPPDGGTCPNGCPIGQSCTPGGCAAICGGVICPAGQGCNASTQCVALCGSGGAITHLCDLGEVCNFANGTCN